jgi:hypothetical protein
VEARRERGAQGKEVSMGKMLSLFAAVGILSAASIALATGADLQDDRDPPH